MSDHPFSSENDQAERERRLDTLRQLAEAAAPLERPHEQSAPPVDQERVPQQDAALEHAPRVSKADGFAALEDWSAPGRRLFWLATLAAVLVVFILYGAIANGALRSASGTRAATTSTPPAPSVMSIPLARDRLTCVSDLAWSPDSARVAALGYSTPGQCAGVGYVNLYDATSGKLTTALTLDTVVLRALTTINSDSNLNPFITYQRTVWSPSGRLLAVTLTIYTALVAPNTSANLAYSGLVLMDSSGGNIKVLLQPYPAYNAVATRWDLTAGKATIIPAPTVTVGPDTLTYSTLPPALWYSWTADDALVASVALRTDTTPQGGPLTQASAPIGNPTSDGQFSVWQSGVASLRMTPMHGGGDTVIPGAYTWDTAFATWSPDGRYLVDPVSLSARMQPHGATAPSGQGLRTLGLAGSPLLPVRDAGLGAVLGGMSSTGYDPASQRVILAWNADAHLLAAYPSSSLTPAYLPGQTPQVTIYDATSGAIMRRLTVSSTVGPTYLRVDGAVRWSPDSRRLALYEPGLDRLLVWNTSSIAA